MKIRFSIVLTLLMTCYGQVYSCTCGSMAIEREVDSAYDIIVGRVIFEKEDTLTCTDLVDYSYNFEVEFSYKEELNGLTTIFGGKGGGSCGAIFEKGKEYLIVVRKCDKGLYTFLCSDNQLTTNAKSQIEFLNGYFNKEYQPLKIEFLIPIVMLSLIVLTATGLVTFNFYKKRLATQN